MNAATLARVAQLEQVFTDIAATRMQGVPVQNTALRVQAVGFDVLADEPTPMLLGILITPWFMNLLRLPLHKNTCTSAAEPGSKHSHRCGGQVFEFIVAHEEALGRFEACSLFSPMFEFADQAGAVATAHEVLKLLRTAPAEVTPRQQALSPSAAASAPESPVLPVPSRRSFLLGRVRPGTAP